jgi:hypothetical protein
MWFRAAGSNCEAPTAFSMASFRIRLSLDMVRGLGEFLITNVEKHGFKYSTESVPTITSTYSLSEDHICFLPIKLEANTFLSGRTHMDL